MNATSSRSPQTRPHRSRPEGRAGFGRVLLLCIALLLCLPLAACGPSKSDAAIAIVEAAYDRLNEGDVDGFLGYFSDDAVLMSGGLPIGLEAAREEYLKVVAATELRYELSDLASDGKLVTSTCDAFFRDQLKARHSDWVNVVVDGQIIFEGLTMDLSAECEKDPSQAFCP